VYDYFYFIQIANREHGIREGQVIGFFLWYCFPQYFVFSGSVLGGIRYDGITYITRLFALLFTSVAGWGVGLVFLVPCFVYRIGGDAGRCTRLGWVDFCIYIGEVHFWVSCNGLYQSTTST
jgi:hypothetical protein